MLRVVLLVLLCVTSLSAGRADTYVVLPFFNLTKSPNLDWIGESIAETLRETLASKGVLVIDREDRSEVYRRLSLRPYVLLTRASVVQVAENLDAHHVIYGHFELIPPEDADSESLGTIKITARILDLRRIRRGPEFTESGSLEELAWLQSHLAWQALQFLVPGAAPTEREFRRENTPVRLDAVENYVRGLLAPTPEQKHRFFTQAARLDPDYTQPCFQLGRLHFQRKDYRIAADWFQRVGESHVHFREAKYFLGLSLYYMNDFEAAEQAFELVAATVPLNEVFNNLAAAQSRRGLPAAIENFRRALEGDPGDPAYHFNLGYLLWKQGRFDEAAERFRDALDREPSDQQAILMLGRCVKKAGPRPSDPRSEGLERLKENYDESAYWQLKAMLEPEKN